MTDSTGPANPHELAFWLWAESEGWTTTKRGWPDFICRRRGEVMAVEVKGGSDWVRPEQWATIADLRAAGLPTYLWTAEDGLQAVGSTVMGDSILTLREDNARLRKALGDLYDTSMRVKAVPRSPERRVRWVDEDALVLIEIAEMCKARHKDHSSEVPAEGMTLCAWIVKMYGLLEPSEMADIVKVPEEKVMRLLTGAMAHRARFLKQRDDRFHRTLTYAQPL